ncbi:MAG: DUF2726 domain-containing protein [Halofilum sp. (in: g-proteobacteria)]
MDWFESFPPWALFPGVPLAVLLAIAVLALALRRRTRVSYPYNRRPAVLAPDERALHQSLEQAVGDRALILPKLHAGDALSVRRNLSRRRAAGALNRLGAHAFDFVVCDPRDTRPLVAVELERPQEAAEHRRQARFLEEACHAAGFELLRVPAGEQYSTDELREQLRPYLERSNGFDAGDLTTDGRREPILDLPAE